MLCVQQDFPSKPYYWNILKYEVESIIDTFVPLKKKQGKRSRKKHLSKEAIRKIVFKQNMWRVYRVQPTVTFPTGGHVNVLQNYKKT